MRWRRPRLEGSYRAGLLSERQGEPKAGGATEEGQAGGGNVALLGSGTENNRLFSAAVSALSYSPPINATPGRKGGEG